MKKFLNENVLQSMEPPQDFGSDLNPYLPFNLRQVIDLESSSVQCPSRYRTRPLTNFELTSVQHVLSKILHVPLTSISVNSCYKQYTSLVISGKTFNSCLKRSSHNFISLALWDTDVFGTPPSRLPQPIIQDKDEHIRPIEISYFATITYTIEDDENNFSETFAVASWFSPHPSRYELGKPADIWCKSLFEVSGPHSFVPYSFIKSRCAYIFTRIEVLDECVLIVVPIIE